MSGRNVRSFFIVLANIRYYRPANAKEEIFIHPVFNNL